VRKFILALALAVGAACIPSIPAFAAPEGSASATTRIYAGYSSVGQAGASYGGRWNIYEGFSYRIGYISRSYGGRWNIYEGYSRVGYAKPSYGGKWDCYSGYSRIGYVKRSFGSRSDVYASYSRVGYVNGTNGGPVGCAALVLGLV
jgi:hypothetical protein